MLCFTMILQFQRVLFNENHGTSLVLLRFPLILGILKCRFLVKHKVWAFFICVCVFFIVFVCFFRVFVRLFSFGLEGPIGMVCCAGEMHRCGVLLWKDAQNWFLGFEGCIGMLSSVGQVFGDPARILMILALEFFDFAVLAQDSFDSGVLP